MTPHLMQQITGSQGNVIATYKPTPMMTAATPAAADAVAKLMITVANDTVPGATANGIFPVSWHVAVKTGTAQVQAPVGPEQTDDWMIGFMPAIGTAQIAVAVVVPDQSFTGTGAGEAGPILKQVLAAFLNETGATK
jgi:cell division protein FtsI/penicillin-binding protein 2